MTTPTNPEITAKQHRVDRLDNADRWVRLGGAIATFVLVVMLLVAAVWQGAKINTLTENDKISSCTLQALAQFAKGTAAAFDTPPAPNEGRSDAVSTILKSVPALTAAAKGHCVSR